MAKRRGIRAVSRRVRNVLWSCALFFALGYFPTMLMPRRSPVVSMALAAAAIIPFGSRSPNVLRGVLRGMGLGAIAGVAISAALVYQRAVPQEYLNRVPLTYIPAAAGMCAIIAGVFAHLATKRRQRVEEEWR